MNHQPFEDWLLDPAALEAKQRGELQAHLKGCADCSALAEVDLALRSARMAAPAEGFGARFEARLAAMKLKERRRNAWGFSLLAGAAAAALAWMAMPLLVEVIGNPANTLAGWLSNLLALWASLQALGHVSKVLFETLPGFVPAAVWLAAALAGSGMSVLWVLSLKRLAIFPQGVSR